jgi:hypothetical protein
MKPPLSCEIGRGIRSTTASFGRSRTPFSKPKKVVAVLPRTSLAPEVDALPTVVCSAIEDRLEVASKVVWAQLALLAASILTAATTRVKKPLEVLEERLA